MQYPGYTVKAGEPNHDLVRLLKKSLNAALGANDDPFLKLDEQNGQFGPRMKQVIKLFQARHVDGMGRPLKQDGEVGPHTWQALFGAQSVPDSSAPPNAFFSRILEIAGAEAKRGVREVPRNSNRGPEVDNYLKRVGLPPGHAWCCAFVYWCMDEAGKALARANPMVKTAGCMDHWNRAVAAGARRIVRSKALENPSLLLPGMIFIMDHGKGLGHTGLIESVKGGMITTLEGNTDASMTREGGGVYRLTRKIGDINKGFIDYSAS